MLVAPRLPSLWSVCATYPSISPAEAWAGPARVGVPGLLAAWPGPRCTRLARVGTMALIPVLGEGLVGQGPCRDPASRRPAVLIVQATNKCSLFLGCN